MCLASLVSSQSFRSRKLHACEAVCSKQLKYRKQETASVAFEQACSISWHSMESIQMLY